MRLRRAGSFGVERASRLVRRVAAVGTGFFGVFLAAGSAWAAAPIVNESGTPGGRLTWVQTTLIFVGIPLAAFLLIGFLVYLPSLVRGPRYRPGRPWPGGTVWFGGPPDADDLIARIEQLPPSTSEGGGAGARW
ncbi:MAG: hypothetical protein IRZ02_05575 [Acidothermus sp.]|nr:hypothetical protein [Acidothermus sp.]MCL6537963.1 hypothetical protein [Acidothermus sp.]